MQKFISNGDVIIQEKISQASRQGIQKVVVTGNYEIMDTIYLPSNMTLVLEDCHLKMADGTFCNMFRNEALRNADFDLEKSDKNIRIIGLGRAILDGGTYNGLSEKNSLKEGMPHVLNNSLLLFCNVENFEIDNIETRNQRYWAQTFYSCRYGKIRNIHVLSDYMRIDENGQVMSGLKRDLYQQTRVKNSDGIDIRVGCHDILIENITGFSEDDTVAVTALSDTYARNMKWTDGNSIYNIMIKNIQSTDFCSNVRLLNQGGIKLYNVAIDGVMAQLNKEYTDYQCGAAVKIGDKRLYGSRHSTQEETYNISVNNVFGVATSVYLAGEMRNCTLTNIFVGENGKMIENHATIYNDN